MKLRLVVPVLLSQTPFLALYLALSGCQSHPANTEPSIEFSKVPAAAEGSRGGLGSLEAITGRVANAHPGQQIVLYARSEDIWWIQPFTDHPFTEVQTDSKWKNQTHLGTEYAALLIDPDYKPPAYSEVLPARGGGVEAVAVINGQGPPPDSAPPKTLHFSGYDWIVRKAASLRGGSWNSFDPANAWTDESGALHLRIAKNQDQWTCVEVKLARNLGYGTYVFVTRDVSHLEPSAVLTLLTWDGFGTEENRRELDIEISRWGYAKNENAHYVVQPYYIPTNVARFQAPAGVLTHTIHWEPAQVTFASYAGSNNPAGARPINQHVFTSGIPPVGGDSVRINLYIFGKGEVPLQHENEVVIEKFEYYP